MSSLGLEIARRQTLLRGKGDAILLALTDGTLAVALGPTRILVHLVEGSDKEPAERRHDQPRQF